MAAWNPEANDIFLTALEFRGSDQRAAYLDQACAGDATLRVQVQALLDASDRAGSFLDRPATGVPARVSETGPSIQEPADEAMVEQAGAVIGPYKILQQIGEGGMGTVYMAEQTEPVQRKVALKIIKPGMDSRQVIARFEQERQALAMMDHPNIAKVLDAGTIANPKSEARNPKQIQSTKSQIQNEAAHNVPDIGASDLGFVSNFDIRASDFSLSGRPYFVMELVKGIPITEYCDSRNLTPQERLQLFLPVCHAVQHAHQKGIIHRDLKPSNVLVAMYDDKPVPKIIDFGVAKATGPKLTERTMFTQFGQLVGTLEYMSPEQAAFNALDIDTRSDIYSLGVLLYELLTGSTPFEKKRLQAAAFDEVLRIIREEEPPKPSTRLSTIEELPAIAARRNTEASRLGRLIKGDLDWIVMKALEKDRARRYETANSLADDIEHYLKDEPVQACPPSAAYRLRKFVRRNQGPVLSVLFVFVALIIGIVGTTFGLIRADAAYREEARQRQIAQDERDDKEIARAAEANHRAIAERERDEKEKALQAEEIQRKKAEANERRANAEKARAETENEIAHAVRDFLQNDLLRMADARNQADAALRSGGAFNVVENPSVKELLNRAAAELVPSKIERKFPGQPVVQAEILRTIGGTYLVTGEYKRAVVHLERSHAVYVKHLGVNEAPTLATASDLGLAYHCSGRLGDAIRLYEETRDRQLRALGPNHRYTLVTLQNLARAYREVGRWREAIALLEQVRAKQLELFGSSDRHTLITTNSLALAYRDVGKSARAIELLEHVRDTRLALLGPDDPGTLHAQGNLAWAYRLAGRAKQAIELLEQVRVRVLDVLGGDHPDTLTTLNNLALCYRSVQRYADALALLEETRDKRVNKYGADHPLSLMTRHNLALVYEDMQRVPEAIELLEQVRDSWTAKFGPDHPATLTTMSALGRAYWSARQYDQAIAVYEEVLRRRRLPAHGTDHPETMQTAFNLGVNYRAGDRIDDAVRIFDEWVPRAAMLLAADHSVRLFGRTEAIVTYTKASLPERAEPLLRETAELAKQQAGLKSQRYQAALWPLVMNLLRQKKWAEGEPLLRDYLILCENSHPDAWTTFHVKSLLGGCLSMQKNYAAAEPLLLEAYEGLKKREASIPSVNKIYLTEAAARLVQMYGKWGNHEVELARWRKELIPYLKKK
jgi:serine/threonine protein kinase